MTHLTQITLAPFPASAAEAVVRMDCLARQGFEAVAEIARSFLVGLDRPEATATHPELVAGALSAIWSTAEAFGNDINALAEHARAHGPDAR